MEEFFQSSPDVEWSCVKLSGIPMLVIQATGPLVTAEWLQRDFKKLELKHLFGLDLKPTTFICVEGGHTMSPILAADIDPMQDPLVQAVENSQPWMLALQYVVERQRYTRLFVTVKDTTAEGPPPGLGLEYPLTHWICDIR